VERALLAVVVERAKALAELRASHVVERKLGPRWQARSSPISSKAARYWRRIENCACASQNDAEIMVDQQRGEQQG
jgi:hypothetical protein